MLAWLALAVSLMLASALAKEIGVTIVSSPPRHLKFIMSGLTW